MKRKEYEKLGGERIFRRGREQTDELLINGSSLTSQIEGYRQLTVTGRHIYPVEVKTVENDYTNGAKVVATKYNPRKLKVKYILQTKSSEELRNKTDEMMRILTGRNQVTFKDDLGYTYREVIFNGAEEQEEYSNNVVGTFTLTAYDPFRYSVEKTRAEVVKTDQDFVIADLVEIEFTNTVTRPTIVFRSDTVGYMTKFRLTGTVNAGTVVKIRQASGGLIYTEGATIELGTLVNGLTLHDNTKGYIEGKPNYGKVMFTWRDKKI